MTGTLYIAAKGPWPGSVKTRLAGAVGAEAAASLYRGFLIDLALRFAGAPFPVSWLVTPDGACREVAALVGAERTRVVAQGAGDWTERQRRLLRRAGRSGPVVLIASDSPQLEVGVVTEAFRLLDAHDLALGPVLDGGYYLIGMRRWVDVLAGIAMSTATVLEQVAAQARAAGLSVGWLPPTFDVDEVDDLRRLRSAVRGRSDLRATRAALVPLVRSGMC